MSSAGADPVLTERIGSALVVTLNRPERLNATNFRMNERLRQIWVDTAADADVRTVILTGAGRGFCVGADATEVLGTRTATDVSLEEEISFLPGRNLDIPVICAVNGLCVGGGLHFVADSDITIASSNAEFMDPHVNMGQVSGIEPASLALRVPVTWLTRLALLGRGERISAGRALEIDLVSEVVEPAVLLGRALELAQAVADASPTAIRGTRRVIRGLIASLLEASMENGWSAVQAQWSHPDCREGPAAFTEKRDPTWA